jgi:putrescine transport system permease protein
MSTIRWWHAGRRACLAWVYLFLYLPIVILMAYSFNANPLGAAWGGFTFDWYARLVQDRELIEAFELSLWVACLSASGSVLLGTLAALSQQQQKPGTIRTLFSGSLLAPLILPEVILGLALLLMLIAMHNAFGFPQRGWQTICIGHTVLGTAYASVLVGSRLRSIDPSLEEAALDLGARPWQVMRTLTLPLLWPSMLAAWLLAFTLSMDEVVIASFLSGPGSNTFPIVIFARAKLGLNPVINAVTTLTVWVVGMFLLLDVYFNHSRKSLPP